EGWAHGVASVVEDALGAAAIGTAGIGVGSAGAEAIGTAIGATTIIIIMTSSSSAASAFRTGAWGGDIRTDLTATATHTDTTMVMVTHMDTATIIITGIITATPVTAIRGTATAIVTAEGLRLRSCNAGWLGRDTTTAALMESWDQRRDARFGRTNAAKTSASTARSIATRFGGQPGLVDPAFDCRSFGWLTGGLARV